MFIASIAFLFHFTGESLQLLQHKMKIIAMPWGNQFSIKAFALVLEKLKNFNYNTVLLNSYAIFAFLTIILLKALQKSDFISKINISSFEEKFFILGANLSISIYLILHNIHYKEIFLILLLPFIMKLKNTFKIKIFKYLFYFILFRYIFLIFSNYFVFFKKNFSFLYFKAASDIILVSLLASICVIMNIEILKKFIKK